MSNVSDNWKTLNKKTVLTTPRFAITKDEVEQPNGVQTTYFVMEKRPFSIIVPLHDDGRMTMVRQYRYAVKTVSLEFPMGVTHELDPEKTARIELQQETGFTASKMTHLSTYWSGVGSTNQEASIFLAEGLTPGNSQPEEGEFFDVERYSQEEIAAMIHEGKIRDIQSIAAFFLTKEYLRSQ